MIAKVLHVWDICGLGGLFARYLDRHYDYESIAIARSSHDPFLHAKDKALVWNHNSKVWLLRCLLKSRNYDIIHIHSLIQWIPIFRRVNKKAKIVIHFHGTRVRGRWDEYNLSDADMILVSTPDLLDDAPDGVMWMPNPVDEEGIELVKDAMYGVEKNPGAFHVSRYAVDKAQEYSDRHGLELNVFNRDETPKPHKSFLILMNQYEYFINVERPKFLCEIGRHEYYVDVKRDYPGYPHEDKIIPAFSLTGLEALALGCKVIDWKGEIHEGLPDVHRSERVAELLHEFYSWGWKE
jgi:predicted nucleotidyltransferase